LPQERAATASIAPQVRSGSALINTAGLQDKTWFIILLVTGLLSFGFIAIIIYLVAGPTMPHGLARSLPPRQAASRDLRSRSA
jgi:hypothetical protein